MHNIPLPFFFFFVCERTLTNKILKPSRLKEYLLKFDSDKLEKSHSFFQYLKLNIEKQATVNSLLKKQKLFDLDEGLIAFFKKKLSVFIDCKKR